MTDNDIIGHLQNNLYSKAINGLYGLMPAVKKYILANNGNAEDAQDIFQDSLVILYKKVQAGNLILTVPLKTYLFAINKNCWLQELRRRNKFPLAAEEKESIDMISDDEPELSIAEAAFSLLGEKCRQLLILFYFKKKSFKEIASLLSFSDEKVAKNQKYRCIQKAKENFVTLSKNDSHG